MLSDNITARKVFYRILYKPFENGLAGKTIEMIRYGEKYHIVTGNSKKKMSIT